MSCGCIDDTEGPNVTWYVACTEVTCPIGTSVVLSADACDVIACTQVSLQFGQVAEVVSIGYYDAQVLGPQGDTSRINTRALMTNVSLVPGSCDAVPGWCAQWHPASSNGACNVLPQPAWNEQPHPTTPCQEFLNLMSACQMASSGLGPLLERTAQWLALAVDYQLQTSTSNALVIARDLCAERSFLDLSCLSSLTGGPEKGDLITMYDSACQLANVTNKLIVAGDPLHPNQVQPLSYSTYDELFSQFEQELEQYGAMGSVNDQADAISEHTHADVPSQGGDWYWAQRLATNQLEAGYLAGVRDLQQEIDAKRHKLGVIPTRLTQALQIQLTDAQTQLEQDRPSGTLNLAAKQQIAKKTGETLFAFIAAVVAAPQSTNGEYTVDMDVCDIAIALAQAGYEYATAALQASSDCGRVDTSTCKAITDELRMARYKLRNLKQVLDTVSGLVELNNLILDPLTTTDISVQSLPDIAFLQSSLAAFDKTTAIEAFRSASEATGATVDGDALQLVLLVESKLSMLTNFFKSVVAREEANVIQLLLERQFSRAQQAQQNSKGSDQVAVYVDSQLRNKCYTALKLLIAQTEAIAYHTLSLEPGLQAMLQQLMQHRLSPLEPNAGYGRLLSDFHNVLLQRWQRQQNYVSTMSCYSGPTFQLDPNSLEYAAFVQTGVLTVEVPLPANTIYYGVTMSDVQIFVVGAAATHGSLVVTAAKTGTSAFLDDAGDEWRFTHQPTDPPFEFQYEVGSCRVLSSSDRRLSSQGTANDIYAHYSPYGAWTIVVDMSTGGVELQDVTAVRLAFNLAYSRGTFAGGSSTLFAGLGCSGVDTASMCSAGVSVPPPPSPTGEIEGIHCSTLAELGAAFDPVNRECCDEPDEDCTSGLPATCNAGCAAVLLPAQAACEGFLSAGGLAMMGTKSLIDSVASLCPPQLPCNTPTELGAAFVPVNRECCDEPDEDCTSGFPATCNAGCAAVLLPTQAACEGFLSAGGLAMAGTKSRIDSVASLCPGGKNGGH